MKLTDAENAADGIFFPALEQNMMGAVLINENDEVMFFNPAAEKLWGYKREEVIGNNIDMLIPRDLRPAHPEYIRHNREGGKARVEGMSRELQLEKKDGSKIWTRFALSKVSAEGKVYYLALVRDASVEIDQKEQNIEGHPIKRRNQKQEFVNCVTLHFLQKEHHILSGDGKNHVKGNNRNHQGAEKQTVFLSAAAAVPKNEIREHLRCPLPVAPSPSGCARRTPAGFRLHAEAHERSRHPG